LLPVLFCAVSCVCIAPSEARPPTDASVLSVDLVGVRYLRDICNCRRLPSCHVPPRAGELPAALSFERDLLQSVEAL
jgi:hypothetical protein